LIVLIPAAESTFKALSTLTLLQPTGLARRRISGTAADAFAEAFNVAHRVAGKRYPFSRSARTGFRLVYDPEFSEH